jgi:hypothetical protein
MSKVSKVQKQKKNIGKALKHPKSKSNKSKLQNKLSEFFRTSPLAEIDLSRDKSSKLNDS